MKAIINAKAVLSDKNGDFYIQENTHILFNERIIGIFQGEIPAEILKLSEENVIDAKNKYLSPGFINIHAHGALGKDTMDEEDDALKIFAQAEAAMGVTSFLPTTMTYDIPRIRRALQRIRKAIRENSQGAKILGAHMEGPYISPKKRGAQDIKHIKPAEFEDIADFTDAIKIITLAPEVTPNSFMEQAKSNGILLSMGHTDATYEEAMSAINSGNVEHITHLYNAMSPFHHREPGVVGAAFDTSVKTELIADNVHSSPTAQRLAYKMKGTASIILITDSIRASCLGDGLSELGGQKVIVKGELATLEDGTIAGSVATMDRVVSIFKENTGVKLEKTIETVTKNPAKSLKIYDKTGSIATGKFADFTIFDDYIKIFTTIVEGEVIYIR